MSTMLEVLRKGYAAFNRDDTSWPAEGEMTFHTVYRFTSEARIAARTVYGTREEALNAL